MGVGKWIGWRSLSGGFFISSEDAQILRLGSQPRQGRDPADSTQCCSFVLILMCFTAQNRSYTVISEHFMNLKSFIWNWSLNDSFYLPGLLAIPFKCLNDNKEGQCCHISRFQWTPQHLRGQRTDLVSGPLEGRSSEDGRVQEKGLAMLWCWLDETEWGLVQQACLLLPLS